MSAVWISWDDHRRSRVMSRELEVPFEVIRRSKIPVIGVLVTLARTVRALSRTSADTVVVQNPSLLLTTTACAMKRRKGFRVVQDLHSYFSLHIHRGVGLRGKVYRLLSRYCIRNADVTIVTNPELKSVIEECGGRGLVLQDAIPTFASSNGHTPAAERRIVYVCTYSEDEPVKEVLEAGRLLDGETKIFVTGRIPEGLRTWSIPQSVKLTDFLSERDYLELLAGSDAVMALTTRDHTLLCGAYEGLAFKKPLILSDKAALRSYFGSNIIYVENTAGSIVDGIRKFYSAKPFFDRHAADLASTLARDWTGLFSELRSFVYRTATAEKVGA
jgi:glycosyltransferase involved in cell wall biosynthesis